MPSRWEVTLPGIDAAAVKLEHLHAVVSSWLDDGDQAHRATAKPYTTCPPRATTTGVLVEIGLLHDHLPERLQAHATAGTRVRLGSTWTTIAAPPRQIDTISWHHLAHTPAAAAWCLEFVTPTTFRRGNTFTPNPSLRPILGSLRDTWRRFAPADLPTLILNLSPEPAWLTDIDITSHVVLVNGLTVSGFTGRLRFACDPDTTTAAAINRLVQLAPYAGVGAYTTRGFGMTRPQPTWPQRTPPQGLGARCHQPDHE